jgi:hypothetical protein
VISSGESEDEELDDRWNTQIFQTEGFKYVYVEEEEDENLPEYFDVNA